MHLCFFIPGSLEAMNPFLGCMPRELHEEYMTDVLTEFMKLAETNKTTNDVVTTFKYVFMVAFARKSWKLQPSIGKICANTTQLGISPGNNAPYNPRKHRTQNCAHSSCVEKQRLHAYTKQFIESYVNIYMCIFLLQIIIHIQVVTETKEVGWVMEGTVCAQD